MVQLGVSQVRTTGVRRRRPRARDRRSSNAKAVGEFAGDAYALAERAMRGVRAITKLVNIEEKAFENSASGTASTAGTVGYMSGLSQGVDVFNRIGDSIKLHSFEFCLNVTQGGALTTWDRVRVLLVRDLENGGATPAVTDILGSASISGFEQWLNRNRFKFLFDEVFDISATANPLATRQVHIPVDRHIKYRSTSNAAAGAAEGSMWWLVICENGVNPSAYALNWRLRYTDD